MYNFYLTSRLTNSEIRGMKLKRLKSEMEIFFDKLKSGENFAFVRNADGERAIMLGISVESQEKKWTSPNFVSALGESIIDSLQINDARFYYAISCPCCDKEAYFWYKTRINSSNLTFANLWINANFRHFKARFEELKRDCVLIANYRAKILLEKMGGGGKLGNMKILAHYAIDDDCINFWEYHAKDMLKQIKNDFGDRENLLFVVSCGPMSSPIIKDLFLHNPNNTYVDFGSSIDSYYLEAQTRPYQDKHSIFGCRNCYLYADLDTDISVVLNLYKRDSVLREQVEAVLNQSIKPKELILFVDSTKKKGDNVAESCIKVESSNLYRLPQDLLEKFDNIIQVENNVGVWGRFAGGLLAKSKFVCFFDDDTIPAHRWLESCFLECLKKDGLYGAIGIISNDLSKYPFDKYYKVGWEHKPPHTRNNTKTMEVDFCGHSWFVKKDYLGAMWLNSSEMYAFGNVSEDAYLSFALRKYLGIKSFVPPHKDRAFFSSIKGVEYGRDEESAISCGVQNLQKMNTALGLLKHKYGMKEVSFSPKYACIYFFKNLVKKCIKDKAKLEAIKSKIQKLF